MTVAHISIIAGLTLCMLRPRIVTAQVSAEDLGIGIVKPNLLGISPLRFYGVPELDQLPDVSQPNDSLVFSRGEHHVEISYAPPWFVPEILKLDYDLLWLRARTISRNWIEVIVNKKTSDTRWVDRNAVTFSNWQEFLLDVVAIEALDPEANPVRSGPDSTTPILSTMRAQLRPLAVQGDWIQISTVGLADRIVPTGWIRWRNGNQLLISYSPLS